MYTPYVYCPTGADFTLYIGVGDIPEENPRDTHCGNLITDEVISGGVHLQFQCQPPLSGQYVYVYVEESFDTIYIGEM